MDYKWQNDKNIFLQTEEDLAVVSQVPPECLDQVLYLFLHSQFLDNYKNFFVFEKLYTNVRLNFYSWQDQKYRNFMRSMMLCLEPRIEQRDNIIIYELDDMNEVLFFNVGTIDVGFELNRQRKFVLRK